MPWTSEWERSGGDGQAVWAFGWSLLVGHPDVCGELPGPCSGRRSTLLPAMALEMSCDTLVPRSVNSGMSTNWIPDRGRGCTPGLAGSASVMAVLVGSANASAASTYCGFS